MSRLILYNAEINAIPNIIDLFLTFKVEESSHLPLFDEP